MYPLSASSAGIRSSTITHDHAGMIPNERDKSVTGSMRRCECVTYQQKYWKYTNAWEPREDTTAQAVANGGHPRRTAHGAACGARVNASEASRRAAPQPPGGEGCSRRDR